MTEEERFAQESGGEHGGVPRVETLPTTIEYILQGRAKITFSSKSSETRTVNFREYAGTVYSYWLEVPSLAKPGETWKTELSVWFPAAYYPLFDEKLNRKQEMQIDILTGQGQMPLSSSQDTLKRVYAEIRRQTDKN
jgi:hypothetical protein